MDNLKKYNQAFINIFAIAPNKLINLEYQDISNWDSVGHMQLISELEETFDIMIDTEDIIDFNSYKKGIEILSKEKYGVKF